MVPRRLRWEVPICDGLVDQDRINEWYTFFNVKGIELVHFALKRKQRKLSMINQQITECKNILEPFKDTAPFITLTKQLNKVLEQKDIELKQRKKRKYLRDSNDYQLEQVFNWQINCKQGKTGSIASSPEREVRIVTPTNNSRYRTPERRSRTPEAVRYERQPEVEQERTHREDNGPRTPKPWWRNKTKNKSPRRPYWKNNGNRRNNRPYQSSYNQRPYQSPNYRMEATQYHQGDNGRYPRHEDNGYYQNQQYNRNEPREYQHTMYRNESRDYHPNTYGNESRDYYQNPNRYESREYQQNQNPNRYESREYQQNPNASESRNYQSNPKRNENTENEQYRYDSRKSPLHTTNGYEPLRNYIDEEQTQSFLEYRKNEDPPPRQDQYTKERSPNTKGDAEQDVKSKRKREH